jgi:hypothetical protein
MTDHNFSRKRHRIGHRGSSRRHGDHARLRQQCGPESADGAWPLPKILASGWFEQGDRIAHPFQDARTITASGPSQVSRYSSPTTSMSVPARPLAAYAGAMHPTRPGVFSLAGDALAADPCMTMTCVAVLRPLGGDDVAGRLGDFVATWGTLRVPGPGSAAFGTSCKGVDDAGSLFSGDCGGILGCVLSRCFAVDDTGGRAQPFRRILAVPARSRQRGRCLPTFALKRWRLRTCGRKVTVSFAPHACINHTSE